MNLKDEMLLWCMVNDPAPGLLEMLLAEATHQGLTNEEGFEYLKAAFEEIEQMCNKDGTGEGLEWAEARRIMHNEWAENHANEANPL